MRFEDLEAFLAVADSGSFSAAAASLHITQPAMSKRIAQLESRLNVLLFDRVGKRVHLTDAGRLLMPRARLLLSGLADVERAMGNLQDRIAGTLRLATSHHIGLHRMAPVLRSYSRRHPEVQLDIRFEDSEAAHELVRQAASELAVVTLNPAGDSQLEYHVLWDDPLCFVVAPDHALSRRRSVTLSDLAAEPVVLPGPSTYTGRIVAALFDAEDLSLAATLSTNYLETISMLVGIGLGWSVLPRSMTSGLHVLETDAVPIGRQLGCVVNPQRTLSNAAAAFIDVLRAHADAPEPLSRGVSGPDRAAAGP
jgi:DNA-binding transcriptional LysR family regulator